MTLAGTVDYNLTTEGKKIFEHMSQPSPDCRKCSHFNTCIIVRYISQQLMPQFGEKDPPFQLGEVARICRFYDLK